MNQINPQKLLNSKWTATHPSDREKHFIVTQIHRDDAGVIAACTLEAVHSKREQRLAWRELKDPEKWRVGWR